MEAGMTMKVEVMETKTGGAEIVEIAVVLYGEAEIAEPLTGMGVQDQVKPAVAEILIH